MIIIDLMTQNRDTVTVIYPHTSILLCRDAFGLIS